MSTFRTRLAAAVTAAALSTTTLALTEAAASAAPVPACGNTALAVTHTPTQGATGHGGLALLFRNVSGHTCSLYGYPGLDALDQHGHLLAHAQRTLHGFMGGASAVQTIVIAPSHFASATVEWLNFNPVTTGACTFSAAIATTPANTTHTVHFPVAVSLCRLQVHPTVAGTSGNNGYATAQLAWIEGSHAISAQHGAYWQQAAAALGSSYPAAVAELDQLIALPDANQNPAQHAAYLHDVAALDSFFGTPGLYA